MWFGRYVSASAVSDTVQLGLEPAPVFVSYVGKSRDNDTITTIHTTQELLNTSLTTFKLETLDIR